MSWVDEADYRESQAQEQTERETTMENPERYVSASEAARMMGVTRQRVAAMVERGDVIAYRPWPRAIRIPVSSIEDWNDGYRRPGIAKRDVLDYLISSVGADLNKITPNELHENLYEFIEGCRGEWTAAQRGDWIATMAMDINEAVQS